MASTSLGLKIYFNVYISTSYGAVDKSILSFEDVD